MGQQCLNLDDCRDPNRLSSNGTLLTDRMLDFFIDHGVHIQLSMDRDAEIYRLQPARRNRAPLH